ncbi:MAG TPA: hypothetical protein VFA20_33655 [Myxococcaceae bacterium]|nr:hypothetical protein [Myxococcaceae bacterium]
MLLRDLENLPGYELVSKGVDDLTRGVSSREALLVSIAASRLRENGIPVPRSVPSEAELQLYRLLRSERPQDAYSFYNSLLRRLISFEKALERLNHQ